MRHLPLTVALTLLSGAAVAQTPFGFHSGGAAGDYTSLNAAGASKADATNGVLTTPSLKGVVHADGLQLGGPVASGNMSANGGDTQNNTGTGLGTVDCPTSSQHSTSAICVRLRAGATPNQNYAINANIDSYPDATRDIVAGYFAAVAHTGSPGVWALNSVTHLAPGSKGGIGYEMDLNNWNCDGGGADDQPAAQGCSFAAPPVGLLLEGANAFTGGSGIDLGHAPGQSVDSWHYGITMLGGGLVRDSSIYTNNGSQIDYKLKGTHSVGIDMAGAAFGAAAMHFANGQQFVWNNPDGSQSHSFLSNGPGFSFGGPSGQVLGIDNGGSLTTPGNINAAGSLILNGGASVAGNATIVNSLLVGGDITTNNGLSVAGFVKGGGLIVHQHTPSSSAEPCQPGQTADDARYHYWCATANHWLRVAGTAF